jgi:hypothetical protein
LAKTAGEASEAAAEIKSDFLPAGATELPVVVSPDRNMGGAKWQFQSS